MLGLGLLSQEQIFVFEEILEKITDDFVFVPPGRGGLEDRPDPRGDVERDEIGDGPPDRSIAVTFGQLFQMGKADGEFLVTFQDDAFGIA